MSVYKSLNWLFLNTIKILVGSFQYHEMDFLTLIIYLRVVGKSSHIHNKKRYISKHVSSSFSSLDRQ